MFKKLFILIFILFIVSCSGNNIVYTPQTVNNFGLLNEPVNISKTAVVPFKYPQNCPYIGNVAQNEFIVQLMKINTFKIADNDNLNKTSLNAENLKKNKIDGVFAGEVYRCSRSDGAKPAIVGINIKLIEVKTGKVVWHGGDLFYGDDPRVSALVRPDERIKLMQDEKFLTRILVREISKSISMISVYNSKPVKKEESISKKPEVKQVPTEKHKVETVEEKAKPEPKTDRKPEPKMFKENVSAPAKPLMIEFHDEILFDKAKARLKKGSIKRLDTVSEILKKFPDILVIVEGHTCDLKIHTKKFPSNWELSYKRAESVAKYFIDNGYINKEKVFIVGWGALAPKVKNTSEKTRKQNRRVEIYIMPDKYIYNRDAIELYRLIPDYLRFHSKNKALELGKQIEEVYSLSDINKLINKRLKTIR